MASCYCMGGPNCCRFQAAQRIITENGWLVIPGGEPKPYVESQEASKEGSSEDRERGGRAVRQDEATPTGSEGDR